MRTERHIPSIGGAVATQETLTVAKRAAWRERTRVCVKAVVSTDIHVQIEQFLRQVQCQNLLKIAKRVGAEPTDVTRHLL